MEAIIRLILYIVGAAGAFAMALVALTYWHNIIAKILTIHMIAWAMSCLVILSVVIPKCLTGVYPEHTPKIMILNSIILAVVPWVTYALWSIAKKRQENEKL